MEDARSATPSNRSSHADQDFSPTGDEDSSQEFVISITAILSSATYHYGKEKVVMACFSCRSEKVKAFTCEINIQFAATANLKKRALESPKLLVCLDCGLADFLLSEDELRNLRETFSSRRQTLAHNAFTPSNEGGPTMTCSSCHSANRREFPSEVLIHLSAELNEPKILLFSHLSVCMECGLTDFVIPSPELKTLRGRAGDHEAKKKFILNRAKGRN